MTAETRLEAEERIVQTVETLIEELRQDLIVEDRAVERLRIERSIQRQERNLADAQGRLNTLRVRLQSSAGQRPSSPLRVFVSYARHDSKTNQDLLGSLLSQLVPAGAEKIIDVWIDQNLELGERWHDVIAKQIARADAALLMISASFLASSYIRAHELPALLERQRLGLTQLLPITLDACDVRSAQYKYPDPTGGPHVCVLSSLQSKPSPEQPLATMATAEANRTLVSIATALRAIAAKRAFNSSRVDVEQA